MREIIRFPTHREQQLSTWQNLFFCEFDGPRPERSVVVTVIADGRSG